jgi:hypothetical protein
MNVLIIILAIIIVLMAYYMYTVFTAVPTVAKNIDLTQAVAPIKPTTIKNPYSVNYTVGVWVYVHNYNEQIDRFLMYGDKGYKGRDSFFSLRMDPTYAKLYCDILVKSATGGTKVQTVSLTPENDTFPIQKWVYVVVSVSRFIECYLNGQFISATQVSDAGVYRASESIDAEAGPTFSFGGKGTTTDNGQLRANGAAVMLTGLSRWDEPMSAGDVYNNYRKGNGYEKSPFGGSYHMDVNVSQDSNTYKFKIF